MFKNKKRTKTLILATLTIIAILAILLIMYYKNYFTKVNSIEFSNVQINTIEDGVYTGEYDVGVLYAKVEVTIDNGSIVNIDLIEHKHERGEQAEIITEKIIENQTIYVDAVTSATNSSKVIKKAVENALLKNQ